MGQTIYGEYIVFRGSNVSCSLTCTKIKAHRISTSAAVLMVGPVLTAHSEDSLLTKGFYPKYFLLTDSMLFC